MPTTIDFSLDLGELEARTHALADALDDEMSRAMGECSELVAAEARNHHLYQNRTGDLQDATRAVGTSGNFLRGSLAGGVVADTPYAEYVNGRSDDAVADGESSPVTARALDRYFGGGPAGASRFEFLQPAADRMAEQCDAIVQQAADRAAQRWNR
jgi:hypothetical protein